jgi:ribose transport system ATP-binding protein
MPGWGNLLIEVRGASKRFPGVLALDRVDLRLHAGEVLAVIGENGAGKSTLMRLLAGIERPDGGQIFLSGRHVQLHSVHDAMRAGIALIHQELSLCDNLTVGANMFLGREPRRFGWIDHRAIARQARAALAQVGLDVDSDTPIAQLSIGQQQMVEIARALASEARILIMDEPTSSLSQSETETLFGVISRLRAQGVAIIYISHRLSEVVAVADRVLVLRDGRVAGRLARAECTHDAMVSLMVGRGITPARRRSVPETGRPLLQVEGLVTAAYPGRPVSLTVRAGELVAVAGLVGAGRSELLRAVFGIDRRRAGRVTVAGRVLRGADPGEAMRAGLALVPEDRKTQGVILEMTAGENLTLAALPRQARAGVVLDRRAELQLARQMMDRLRIRAPGVRQVVQYLSGGNQQKVVLGKWLALRPQVLLLDEPTRGVDIGAKQEIYALMRQWAEQGMAVLFVSSDMEEILGVADRVLVMHEGQLRGPLAGGQVTEQRIMQLATGQQS